MVRLNVSDYMDPEDIDALIQRCQEEATDAAGYIDRDIQIKLVEEAASEVLADADADAIKAIMIHDWAMSKVHGTRGGNKLKFRNGAPRFRPGSIITVSRNLDILCTRANMEDWLAVLSIDTKNIAKQMAASAQKHAFVESLPPLYKKHKTMDKIIQLHFGFVEEDDDDDEDDDDVGFVSA